MVISRIPVSFSPIWETHNKWTKFLQAQLAEDDGYAYKEDPVPMDTHYLNQRPHPPICRVTYFALLLLFYFLGKQRSSIWR